jgi:hypothetical protein
MLSEVTNTTNTISQIMSPFSNLCVGAAGSLLVRVLDQKVAGSNPCADKVNICHSAPEQGS